MKKCVKKMLILKVELINVIDIIFIILVFFNVSNYQQFFKYVN